MFTLGLIMGYACASVVLLIIKPPEWLTKWFR